jgi:hypothetical protein
MKREKQIELPSEAVKHGEIQWASNRHYTALTDTQGVMQNVNQHSRLDNIHVATT